MNRAIFLDRDGTLIEERDYLHRVEQVVIYPGVVQALRKLQLGGFKLFIVSNQSGVGRGYFTLADVETVNQHLTHLFGQAGVSFEKIYVAPEAPEMPSRGRKPSPQFLFDARDEFTIDLSRSYMIGDKLIDLECGWNAGVKTAVLVRTGYGQKAERDDGGLLTKAKVVADLKSAADWILNTENIPA
jgi:D-glycero-D-manno-heptose 1,7-bisphosphate phosphatase